MFHFLRILLLSTTLIPQFFAQSAAAPRHRSDRFIVQLNSDYDPRKFVSDFNRLTGGAAGAFLKKSMPGSINLHLIGFDESYSNAGQILDEALQVPGVLAVQWNYFVEERGLTPNDPDWFQQADMSLINVSEVWSTSTGGVTPRGDTIVVAVLEKGALLSHPDLAPNRFWNWHDSPKDNIDNDGDGYLNDFGGWNVDTDQDDTGLEGPHGTGVYGIIGAAGNNNKGVAGVNWNVKMLNVSGVIDDWNVLEGFRYVLKMRQLYNETNGQKGAFIVATNASFGFNNQFPSSTPIFYSWCQLYDSLGMAGVVNVGATTNEDTNVDVDGDMPTSCGSPYLISVTEINTLGSRLPAGYGKVSIDLAAPGTGTYTTSVSNGTPTYSNYLNGTSAATPHVTGAVALLYSLGCEGFTSDALSDPAACASRVRDVILENTTPNDDMTNITVTGGQLDLKKAVDGVTELCAGQVGPLDILSVRTFRTDNRLRLYYQTPIFLPYRFRVFNLIGQMMYDEELHPKQFSENYVDYDFSDLPQGVYFVSISRGNAVVSVKFPKI